MRKWLSGYQGLSVADLIRASTAQNAQSTKCLITWLGPE